MKLRILTAALLASLMAVSSLIVPGCTREASDGVPSQQETGDPPGDPPVDSDATAATTRPGSEPLAGSCDGSCCFGLHRGDDPGTCKECGKQTPVESHALCTACAERGGRCTHCMKTIHREQ